MKRFLLIAIPLLAIGLAYLNFKTPTYSWRQKLTATIKTPDGPKSGSGVVEVNLRVRKRDRIGGGKFGWSYWGEGAVVDLGDGKYVFASFYNEKRSMQPDVIIRTAHDRLGSEPYFGIKISEWVRNLKRDKTVFELVNKEYPMLIAFKDINDPTTVTLLKDGGDFRRVFGKGYQLMGMTLQVTKEEQTDGMIFNLLPWAEDHWGELFFDGKKHISIPTEATFSRQNSIGILKRIKR